MTTTIAAETRTTLLTLTIQEIAEHYSYSGRDPQNLITAVTEFCSLLPERMSYEAYDAAVRALDINAEVSVIREHTELLRAVRGVAA